MEINFLTDNEYRQIIPFTWNYSCCADYSSGIRYSFEGILNALLKLLSHTLHQLFVHYAFIAFLTLYTDLYYSHVTYTTIHKYSYASMLPQLLEIKLFDLIFTSNLMEYSC